jgi:RNA polymerase sigma-70 factor, ECF subfamily
LPIGLVRPRFHSIEIRWNETALSTVEYPIVADRGLESLSEIEIVARAADGDEHAFRRLIDLHQSAVAQTISAMLGAGDDADDVGQETFIRFLNSLPKFRGDASVRTYLTRIAVNLSIDALKRRRRTLGWIRLGRSRESMDIPSRDESGLAEEHDVQSRVRSAVNSLDADSRAVVVLRILEERSVRETAELLGIPEGTVMSRLKRSMTKLESHLKPLRPQ